MEPISVLGLLSASASIINACGSIFAGLDQIRTKYKDIPRSLDSIKTECETIRYSMTQIENWINSKTDFIRGNEDFRLVTYSGLNSCSRIIEKLADEIRILSQCDSNVRRRWKKLKSSFGENVIKTYLEELRFQSMAVDRLLNVFQLPTSQQYLSLNQIKTDYMVHSSSSSFIESATASIFSGDADSDSDYDIRPPLSTPQLWSARLWQFKSPTSNSRTIRARTNTSNSSTRQASASPQAPRASKAPRLTQTANASKNPPISYILGGFIVLLLLYLTSLAWPEPVSTCAIEATSSCVLCCPASKGEYYVVRQLLKKGHRASARDSHSQTPLHHAAINGDVATIDLLLEQKDPDWFADRVTPLHLAAKHGNTAAVRALTNVGNHKWWRERTSDLEATAMLRNTSNLLAGPTFEHFFRRKTFTARELAVIFGHAKTALELPERSDDDLHTALSCACMMGNMHMVEDLWRSNEDRYYPWRYGNLLGQARWFPAPPLHLAILSTSRSTMDFLLERRGIDISDQSKKSQNAFPAYSPPAHYAAMIGNVKDIRMLHGKGAKVHVEDAGRRTSLSYAIEFQREDMVDYLLHCYTTPIESRWSQSWKQPADWYLGSGHPWQKDPNTGELVLNTTSRIMASVKPLGILQIRL